MIVTRQQFPGMEKMMLKQTMIFALILFLYALNAHSSDRLKITTFEPDLLVITTGKILTEAYKSLHIKIDIVNQPGRRALLSANTGRSDGELFRVSGIDKDYTNLIMVPSPVNYADTVVFTKEIVFPVRDWKSLTPYAIGIHMGFQMGEKNTRGMDVYLAAKLETLFRMLESGKLDLIVESRIGGEYILKRHGISGIKILSPPINTVNLYHYLHKKHKALVPRISEKLLQMQLSGQMEEIRAQVLYEFSKLP